MECKLFSAELAKGIYRISDSLHGPNSDGFSDAPGQATQNSYLILGEERAALIDMAVDTPELYSFACRLANKPVTVLLTHVRHIPVENADCALICQQPFIGGEG